MTTTNYSRTAQRLYAKGKVCSLFRLLLTKWASFGLQDQRQAELLIARLNNGSSLNDALYSTARDRH